MANKSNETAKRQMDSNPETQAKRAIAKLKARCTVPLPPDFPNGFRSIFEDNKLFAIREYSSMNDDEKWQLRAYKEMLETGQNELAVALCEIIDDVDLVVRIMESTACITVASIALGGFDMDQMLDRVLREHRKQHAPN